jgi:hypothetical protein
MAQSDMNIANQGFPAFRSDLNSALVALVSNSSGSTAPSDTFAHQFWVDTSANPSVLKQRNADDDAWITIGSIDQTNDTFNLAVAQGGTGAADAATALANLSGVALTGNQTIEGTKTFSSDSVHNGLTVGRGAGAVSTNTAVGASALAANTTGAYNSAFGTSALSLNQGGSFNTGLGWGALASSVSGAQNTAVGQNSLYNNTGDYNTAVGRSALLANTSGGNNTAIGREALISNTTASNNTAVGYQAGYSNQTQGGLTAVGYLAGYAFVGGSDAVGTSFFGTNAGQSVTSGSDNTFLGGYSGQATTSGAKNVALGAQALQANTTASNNTAVGYQAGFSNTTGTLCTFLGYQAGFSQTATGNVGNTFLGVNAGLEVTSGTGNTFVGAWSPASNSGAGQLMTTGSKNTILGSYNGNQGGLDIRTASNYIVLSDGDGNPRMFCDASGNPNFPTAYAHTTASAANAFIRSDGYLMRSTSALKYKQDIRDVEDFDINLLRPVRYKSKCKGDDQTKDHLGLIADEAAETGFEELVTRNEQGEVEGFQYERLTVVLLKELQTLRARVAQLESNP